MNFLLVIAVALTALLEAGLPRTVAAADTDSGPRFRYASQDSVIQIEGSQLRDEWIVIKHERSHSESEGADQYRVVARVKISQDRVKRAGPAQLNGEGGMEYVAISRMDGVEPYFQVQIIELLPHGFVSSDYSSFGRPKIFRDGRIALGSGRYEGAKTKIRYESFLYKAGQLVPAKGKEAPGK